MPLAQLNASPHTIGSYRDTFRLLLAFASEQVGKQPCELDIDDLDAPLIGAFLNHLEQDRGNSPRTRNNRLAAIHSLYRHAAFMHPEHLQTIGRVMAIPAKRYQRVIAAAVPAVAVGRGEQRPDLVPVEVVDVVALVTTCYSSYKTGSRRCYSPDGGRHTFCVSAKCKVTVTPGCVNM